MSFSNTWENAVLDRITAGAGTTDSPSNLFVGLSTSTPTDAVASVTEPGSGAYARVSTANTDWNAASGGSVDNLNAIDFPTATGSWGTVTHFVIFNHATASAESNYLAWGALDTSRTIVTDDQPSFAAGALAITLD